MRLCRILALLLGAITAAFVAYEFSQDNTITPVLLGLAGASGVIVIGSILPIKRPINRVLLGAGIILYLLGVSSAIAISYDTAQTLEMRSGLVSFMMASLFLAMFWAYSNRAKPRRGFNRYYDR